MTEQPREELCTIIKDCIISDVRTNQFLFEFENRAWLERRTSLASSDDRRHEKWQKRLLTAMSPTNCDIFG